MDQLCGCEWCSLSRTDFAEARGRYAASREWQVLRRAVFTRAGGTCERCAKNPATQVHHMTYTRRFHERVSDLLAVCRPCHEWYSGKDIPDPENGVVFTLPTPPPVRVIVEPSPAASGGIRDVAGGARRVVP